MVGEGDRFARRRWLKTEALTEDIQSPFSPPTYHPSKTIVGKPRSHRKVTHNLLIMLFSMCQRKVFRCVTCTNYRSECLFQNAVDAKSKFPRSLVSSRLALTIPFRVHFKLILFSGLLCFEGRRTSTTICFSKETKLLPTNNL